MRISDWSSDVCSSDLGDREGGYNPRHAAYDLTLVMGEKDRERLIERKLVTAQNCKVTGYSKFELMAPRQRFFDNNLPVVLYNPPFDKELLSWLHHGPDILQIGRASGRERVGQYVKISVGAVIIKKKQDKKKIQ